MKNIVIGILVAVIIYLFFFFKSEIKEKETNYVNNTEALVDQIESVKNKLGEASSKITTLESENTDLILAVNSKDSSIIRLQTLVEKYKKDIDNGGSITVIHDTVEVIKTVAIDSNTFNFKDHWVDLSGVISDSLSFNLKVNNDYSVILGYEKDGWFKRKPYTLVTNRNPYSQVSQVRSYKVTIPKPKWSVGVTGGYGLIRSNERVYSGFGLMLGVNYRLL